MTYLTPEAQQRLDEYLTEVRAALAGCRTVDPDEIEQDICAHIAAEFPPSYGPVSRLSLEPVLARLGSPEQWVPEEERTAWRRWRARLQHVRDAGLEAGQMALARLRRLRGGARKLGRLARARLHGVPGHARQAGRFAVEHLRGLPGHARQVGGLAVGSLQQAGGLALQPLRGLRDSGRRVRSSGLAWLRQGPEDWRLAYLAFGLLAVGLIIPPLLIGLLPASFCVARAAVAVAQDRGEPLGAQRWLIYPPLVLFGVFLFLLIFLWPLAPAFGVAHQLWHTHREEVVAAVQLPRSWVDAALITSVAAGALALWWVVLGTVLWAAPRVAVAVFRPFADGFGRQQAGALVLTGLGVLALLLSLAVRVVDTDNLPVRFNNSQAERWTQAASADWPGR